MLARLIAAGPAASSGVQGQEIRGITHGVVMMTSASTSSLSKVEFSPSLSEVVTSVWPWSSNHLRMPSSFSVVPSRSGCCSRERKAVSPCSLDMQQFEGGEGLG